MPTIALIQTALLVTNQLVDRGQDSNVSLKGLFISVSEELYAVRAKFELSTGDYVQQ